MSENEMSESDNNSVKIRIPSWFTGSLIVAVLWNAIGVMAFIGQMMTTPEMLAELPPAEQALYESVPFWAIAAFAIAVFGGFLGSILLLMKKQASLILLQASVLGVMVQMSHTIFVSNAYEVYGPDGFVMPAIVFIIAVLLVKLAKRAQVNHWLS